MWWKWNPIVPSMTIIITQLPWSSSFDYWLFLKKLFADLYLPEYDTQLAPAGPPESDMASSSYLESNHNHSAVGGCGVRARSGMPSGTSLGSSGPAGGLERPPGSMDRVLKIFHYFETNSEPCTWASNIRHGDGTDVRVSCTCLRRLASFFFFIVTSLLFLTGCHPENSRNPQTALCVLSGPPSHSPPLRRAALAAPRLGRFSRQGEVWKTASPGGVEVELQTSIIFFGHGHCTDFCHWENGKSHLELAVSLFNELLGQCIRCPTCCNRVRQFFITNLWTLCSSMEHYIKMTVDTSARLLPDGRDGALVKPQNCKLSMINGVSCSVSYDPRLNHLNGQ